MKLAIISLRSRSSEMIAEECRKYFTEVDMLELRKIEINADTKGVDVLYEGKKIKEYDCIYCRGSFKYALLLRAITSALNNKAYMPLSPECFTIGHNKYLTLLELQKRGLEFPKTYLAANTKAAKKIVKGIHYPAIIKIPGGTHGKGVMFSDSVESANSILDALEVFKQSYIIQEYIETGATDIRTIVANNDVVACMTRKAMKGDLRANIHSGGVGEKMIPTEEIKEMSVKCSKAIGADICAVDLLKNASKTCVIEVNISPGIQGITEVTKKNVARDIARALHEKTLEFLKNKNKDNYNGVLKEFNIKGGEEKQQELVANLDVKLGRIKLPQIVTKLSGFEDGQEVIIKTRKGKIIMKGGGE
jgi:ribosomal protein S6--L-glutamate ligase